MILRFKAYSRTNKDIEEVLQQGHLRGCAVNNPILVFGNTIVNSAYNLRVLCRELHKFVIRYIDVKHGSFEIEVDDMIGKIIKEKYGFKK